MLSGKELFDAGSESALPGGPKLVYAGSGFIVVYKPPGMHCAAAPKKLDMGSTGAQTGSGGQSLSEWVFERWPEAARAGSTMDGGMIHRIDYGTSGLVLFALDRQHCEALRAEQEKDGIRKEYLLRCSVHAEPEWCLPGAKPGMGRPSGLSCGEWQDALGAFSRGTGCAIRFPLEAACRFRPYGPGGAHVACLSPEQPLPAGRRAHGSPEWLYRSLILSLNPDPDGERIFDSEGRAAVECRVSITRGFRHQIRAQMAWLGLPLLGDSGYGGPAAPRLDLHAAVIEFHSPTDGKDYHIEL